MKTESFNNLEATFLSKFNEGNNTLDKLINVVPYNEKTLLTVIETLTNKNIIKFDNIRKEYIYDSVVNGNIIILDGNIMLPVTIIKTATKTLVSRGSWYEFDLDFDPRRIVWNVQLPAKTKSTLVELIQNSVLKLPKTKIVQLAEYTNLQGKLVPWTENVKLQLNTIGEDISSINIIFIQKIGDLIEFRQFSVPSVISTNELILELSKSPEKRNYKNIKLNLIFNLSDFIFSGNAIPYLYDNKNSDDESLCYGKITATKGKFEITYQQIDDNGKIDTLNIEEFIDIAEGIEKVKELFAGYGDLLLSKNNFLIEKSE